MAAARAPRPRTVDPEPAAEPKPHALAPYQLFGRVDGGESPVVTWMELGLVQAPTYGAAMERARELFHTWLQAQSTEENPMPAVVKLTVAAIAARNWNQGTALIESRPVTTWEK